MAENGEPDAKCSKTEVKLLVIKISIETFY